MANWNIKKKNGQNVMFNDNPRTRTKENYTQNNFIERNTTVNGIPTFDHTQSRGFNQNNFDALSYDEIPDYIIHRHDVIEHRMNPEDLQKMMRMDEESIKEDQKKERIVMLICFFLLPPLFIVVLILKICGLLSYK